MTGNEKIGRLIRKGKVKDVYEADSNQLMFHFTDRVSAFDVVLPSTIPRKGEALCKFAEYWFETLKTPNHMVKVVDKDKMLVKKVEIIPIECVVRGYLYGSFYERVMRKEVSFTGQPVLASKLPEPIFDPTTKHEAKDRPVTREEILSKRWLTEKELRDLEKRSIDLYKQMSKQVAKAGFIIADVKFEFGRDKDGAVLLADSVGPDEFRLWSKEQYKVGESQEAFDKQVVRDWLIQVGYKKQLDEARRRGEKKDPEPPKLPKELVSKVLERYIYAYEKITGRKFD
ncbi:MAG: phosphoribosylaminoimidazolesuccinocarboxamide synthase [Thaumarchaeota archaeon]|nr:phosphoribosylaminoimidazolesuccinocarboxamide synthase [Nitrososphaerota archaeon]MCL5318300.1 phosphoribosylaminoimidazolesuccinocarboxamide synthase [Nitrososphaerota archaeon]